MYWFIASVVAVFMLFVPANQPTASNPITKTYCTQATGFDTTDELKLTLLTSAKRLAVDELFGELISASTAVKNFVVTSDQIRSSSLGLVRMEGNAEYFNGKSFAETCVTIQAYVTAQDLAKFEAVQLTKKACVTDPNMTTKQISEEARRQAIIQAVTAYDPKLESLSEHALLQLMQRVEYPESGFVADTETYCARVVGQIIPIEAMAALDSGGSGFAAVNRTGGANGMTDEFTSERLDSSWTVLNEDDGKWSLSKVPGSLRIVTSSTDFHQKCTTYRNVFLQDAPLGNFEVITELSMVPAELFQQGGLIAFVDADNYVKLDFVFTEPNNPDRYAELFIEQGGRTLEQFPHVKVKANTTHLFLKLARSGQEYSGQFSYDGDVWIDIGTEKFDSTGNARVGLYALKGIDSKNNWSCDNTHTSETPVDFNFFQLTLNE